MSTTVTYQCPNCSAGLHFDPEKQKFCCEFCLSEFTETELNSSGSQQKAQAEENKNNSFCEHMLEYYCPNCGAVITADESTAADFCCYCHNPVVLNGKLSGQMQPQKIIPFRFDRAHAKEKFLEWAKKKKFCPTDFFSEGNADHIRGVYYPFWVTDADTDSTYQTTAHKTRAWFVGKVKYIETSDFRIVRRGDIHFEDIVTSALSEADKTMLEGVLPYPSDSLQDFSMPYLLGFVAKKRDIEREKITDEVRGRMNSYAASLMRNTIQGYNSVDPGAANVNVTHSNWDYTLMPIWILTYHRKGKAYTFAMNGYTEKIYGELPVSGLKLALLGSLVGLAAAALAFLLGVLICL